MYVLSIDAGRKLVTSDVEGVRLYELDGAGNAKQVASVEQPGEKPFFEQSAAGERLAHASGVIARSFTPRNLGVHWAEAPTSIGTYSASDLSTIRLFDTKVRLDHESLALSPDGKTVASVVRGAGAVVFDLSAGAELWRVPGEIGSGTSWSSDGRFLALGETGQGGGKFTLIDTRPSGGGAPTKLDLAPPSSEQGLYDSPFASAFSRDGRVVFTSSSWGQGGVAVYDVATGKEIWSVGISTTGEEEEENWPAIEVAFALDDRIVIAVQDGLAQAFRASDGTALSSAKYERADARYFAPDSARRRLWLTREGEPSFVPFPDDWR